MPKMVRWEKVEGEKIPSLMREALVTYKDKESKFYLSNFDKTHGSAIEQVWKVVTKDGEVLKGQYNCCGFRLKFPPIKWATKVVDNKYDASNGEEEEDDDDNRESRCYDVAEVDDDDEEGTVKVSMESIIAAVQEEGRETEEPVKKKRGRPAGSKNKLKLAKKKKGVIK